MAWDLRQYVHNLIEKGLACGLVLHLLGTAAQAQVPIKNYDVVYVDVVNTPTIDGIVSPEEWDAASTGGDGYGILLQEATDPDPYNNRFRLLWSDDGLYLLQEVDFAGFLSNLGGTPQITFGETSMNLYVDPNRDGDLNTDSIGNPYTPEAGGNANVDGYQVSWNQYENLVPGTPTITTFAERNGVGLFTEAHVDSAFGDQGNWNDEGGDVDAGGFGNIILAQNNVNIPPGAATGSGFTPSGVSELFWPWSDFDADAMIDDGQGGTKPTGLNATDGPSPGEVWGFEAAQWDRENAADLRLRWQWQGSTGNFATWPHGTITFLGIDGAIDVVWDGSDGNWNDLNWNGGQSAESVMSTRRGSDGGHNVTISGGVTVTYDQDAEGDFAFRTDNGPADLTITGGATLTMNEETCCPDGRWAQWDGDNLNLDGGTFRRTLTTGMGSLSGGALVVGSWNANDGQQININLTGGGRLENDGILLIGYEDEMGSDVTVNININDGHLDLTGGDNLPIGDLSWDTDLVITSHDPAALNDVGNISNFQAGINFTGPGSITVDEGGIANPRLNGLNIWENVNTRITYQDLWDRGLLQANGLSGLSGDDFGNYFTTSGSSGSSDYQVVLRVIESQWNGAPDGSWDESSNWTNGFVPNGPDARAVFGDNILGPTFVELFDNVTVSELVFDSEHPYEIFDFMQSSITLTGSAAVTVGRGSHTINAFLDGVDGLNKFGDGTLDLAAPNGYSGVTVIHEGTLRLSSIGDLGDTGDGTVIAGDTARLELSDVGIVSEPIEFVARNIDQAPLIVNQAGSNTLTGALSVTSGGFVRVDSDSGTLNLSGDLANDDGSSNAQVATLVMGGAGNGEFTGTFSIGENDITGLTKDGSGTWSLTFSEGFSAEQPNGDVVVAEGTLAIIKPESVGGELKAANMTVRTGATLDTSSFVNYTLQENQNLSGGGTVVATTLSVLGDNEIRPGDHVGTLTVIGNLTASSAFGDPDLPKGFFFELSDTTTVGGGVNDFVDVSGTLTLELSEEGPLSIHILPAGETGLANGTYRLFNAGALIGGVNELTLLHETRYNVSLETGGDELSEHVNLTVSGSNANLTWTGATDGMWDINTSQNWDNNGPDVFFDADAVTFDDSAANNTVALVEDVRPASITIDNESSDYIFTGPGQILGAAALIKSGTGSATFEDSHEFGSVDIQGGTVALAAASQLSVLADVEIQESGILRGAGTVTAQHVFNRGQMAPEIIQIDGDYTQEASGVLEIEIGGTAPGTEHDQLVVTGTATLDGRLQLPLINNFNVDAVAGDEVVFLQAGAVTGQFASFFSPDHDSLSRDLAIQLVQSSTDARVRFVAPSTQVQFTGNLLRNLWDSDPSSWTTPIPPNSTHAITVGSGVTGDKTLVVARPGIEAEEPLNAFLHSLTVIGCRPDGDLSCFTDMTLEIPTDSNLSVVKAITIGQGGIVQLSGGKVVTPHVTIKSEGVLQLDGGTLLAPDVTVELGGQAFGNGTIAGDVVNASQLSPGSTTPESARTLRIDGSFTQLPDGTLTIDIEGTGESIISDLLDVGGAAILDGKLTINVTDQMVMPLDRFPILQAGTLATDSVFETLEWSGASPDIYFVLIYPDSTPASGQSVIPASEVIHVEAGRFGDMNINGILDPDDIRYLALGLADPDAYYNTLIPDGSGRFIGRSPVAPGDLYPVGAPDGHLDFDDISAFADLFGMSTAQLLALLRNPLPSVPEPSSALQLLVAISLSMIVGVPRTRNRKR